MTGIFITVAGLELTKKAGDTICTTGARRFGPQTFVADEEWYLTLTQNFRKYT